MEPKPDRPWVKPARKIMRTMRIYSFTNLAAPGGLMPRQCPSNYSLTMPCFTANRTSSAELFSAEFSIIAYLWNSTILARRWNLTGESWHKKYDPDVLNSKFSGIQGPELC
jgi:hypothetical protein